jgi:hypothetical protein
MENGKWTTENGECGLSPRFQVQVPRSEFLVPGGSESQVLIPTSKVSRGHSQAPGSEVVATHNSQFPVPSSQFPVPSFEFRVPSALCNPSRFRVPSANFQPKVPQEVWDETPQRVGDGEWRIGNPVPAQGSGFRYAIAWFEIPSPKHKFQVLRGDRKPRRMPHEFGTKLQVPSQQNAFQIWDDASQTNPSIAEVLGRNSKFQGSRKLISAEPMVAEVLGRTPSSSPAENSLQPTRPSTRFWDETSARGWPKCHTSFGTNGKFQVPLTTDC